jgi:hypothetical protein
MTRVSLKELGRSRQLAFARETRGDIESRELHLACFTHQDVVRLDVLMDLAAPVGDDPRDEWQKKPCERA